MMVKPYEFYDYGEFEQFCDPERSPLAEASRHRIYADRKHRFDEEPEGRKDYHDLEGKTAVFNDRDGELSYVSSEIYDLVQHHEVFSAIKTAVDATVGDIDFGMVRDYGSRVDGILVFGNQEEANIDMRELLGEDYIPPEGRPQTDPTAEDSRWRDSVGLGMRFRNSFDGGTKVGGSTMGYRYICQNWLVWDEAEIGSIERQHTRSIDEPDGLKADFFEEIISDVFDVREDVEKVFLLAEDEELPLEWVPGILSAHDFGPRYQKRITGRVLQQHPVSDDGSDTTMWRLYNAATSELDKNTAEKASAYTYDYYQSYAWDMVTSEPEEPEEPAENMDELRDFAILP